MRNFFSLVGAMVLSVALYVLVFGFIVQRPLVVDVVASLLSAKLHYASGFSDQKKIFIVAGSNARFSHSCAVLEEELHRPCINLGVTADIGLDYTFQSAQRYLRKGDIVYLPIEYPLYGRDRADAYTGVDAAYRFRHDKLSLISRGPEGIVRAGFMFDLPDLIQSLGEMVLSGMGVHRRLGLATMNKEGDEIGHTDQIARQYSSYIHQLKYNGPDPKTLMDNPEGDQRFIGDFLDWCRDHGVTAIGGLPTTFNDVPVGKDVIEELSQFYQRHHSRLLVLSNLSQYPRDDFYDTDAHLREEWQKYHSLLLSQALRPYISN